MYILVLLLCIIYWKPKAIYSSENQHPAYTTVVHWKTPAWRYSRTSEVMDTTSTSTMTRYPAFHKQAANSWRLELAARTGRQAPAAQARTTPTAKLLKSSTPVTPSWTPTYSKFALGVFLPYSVGAAPVLCGQKSWWPTIMWPPPPYLIAQIQPKKMPPIEQKIT